MFPSHIPSELLSPFHSFLFLFLFTIFPFTALSLKLSKMSKKTFKCFINGNSREMAIETPISTIRRCIFFLQFYLFMFILAVLSPLVVHRLCLVAVSRRYCVAVVVSHCGGFSHCKARALGCTGSIVVVRRPTCPLACGSCTRD